jgi:hypothetical protein
VAKVAIKSPFHFPFFRGGIVSDRFRFFFGKEGKGDLWEAVAWKYAANFRVTILAGC